jgi:hypothetical protein
MLPRVFRSGLVLLHLLLACGSTAAAPPPQPLSFPPRPRFAEAARLREARTAFPATRNQTVRHAGELLAKPLEIPRQEGQWIFYYQFPKDEESQKPATGQSLFFHAGPEYSACLMDAGAAYPGVSLRRFLVLQESVLVDAFTVRAKRPVLMDWVTHIRGVFRPGMAMVMPGHSLATRNGYQHLREVRQAVGTDLAEFTWDQPTGEALRLFCLGDARSTVYSGLGIGADLKEEIPFLIRRRQAESALFLTVYDLAATPGNRVAAVAELPIPETTANDACGVRITAGDGRELHVWLDLREKAVPVRLADGATFTRLRITRDQSAP